VQFWFIFGLIFVAIATPLAPLIIQVVYLNSQLCIPYHTCEKFLKFFAQNWNWCNFVYFCLNLVTMATPLAPLKFLIAYLILPTPKTLLFVWKKFSIFCAELKSCNFCLFLPKFGCHGNCLGSLRISDSIFNFAEPRKPYYLYEKVLDFLRRAEICAIFAYFLPKYCCHGNSLGSLKC